MLPTTRQWVRPVVGETVNLVSYECISNRFRLSSAFISKWRVLLLPTCTQAFDTRLAPCYDLLLLTIDFCHHEGWEGNERFVKQVCCLSHHAK